MLLSSIGLTSRSSQRPASEPRASGTPSRRSRLDHHRAAASVRSHPGCWSARPVAARRPRRGTSHRSYRRPGPSMAGHRRSCRQRAAVAGRRRPRGRTARSTGPSALGSRSSPASILADPRSWPMRINPLGRAAKHQQKRTARRRMYFCLRRKSSSSSGMRKAQRWPRPGHRSRHPNIRRRVVTAADGRAWISAGGPAGRAALVRRLQSRAPAICRNPSRGRRARRRAWRPRKSLRRRASSRPSTGSARLYVWCVEFSGVFEGQGSCHLHKQGAWRPADRDIGEVS